MASDPLLVLVTRSPPITTTISWPKLGVGVVWQMIELKGRVVDTIPDLKKDLLVLAEEQKLLSRLLYKIHNRFHNDKGYKDLRMYEKSLKKTLAHNFISSVEKFLSFLPTHPLPSPNLPTKEMLRHSCLQLYGAGALLARLEVLGGMSGLLALQRLNLGHFWGVGAQQLACVARTWMVARHLLLQVDRIFRLMRGQIGDVMSGEVEEYLSILPHNLEKFMPENLMEAELENTDRVKENNKEEKSMSVESFLDIGVPINRSFGDVGISVKRTEIIVTPDTSQTEDLQDLNKKRKMDAAASTNASGSIKTSSAKDTLSNIHSIEELKAFIKKETSERKVSRKTCYTSSLNQETWKALKKEVWSNINEKTPNKSLKLCRKILRNSVKT